MSAIENCRTAALGGHVARCEDCSHTQIAYNSCRNRHCPKCQGAAAKQWLAEREAELLPVPYYHVVFTLPAPISDIAYQNKAVIYDLLFKASAEALTHDRRRSKAPRRACRHHLRAAHLGLGDDASPARAHDRAGRRHLARRQALGVVPARLLPAGARALAPVPPAVPGASSSPRTRPAVSSSSASTAALAKHQAFAAYLAPLRRTEWVVYAKRPFGGPEAVLAYLSRYTHRVAISNRRLIAFDSNGVTFKWKDYRAKGRERAKVMTLASNEFIRRFLIHVLPQRLPPHPPLRPVRQQQACREHRASTSTARRPKTSERERRCRRC